MTRKRVATAIATVALAAAGYLGIQQLSVQAVDMCVTVWEDQTGGGDHMTICNLPSSLKVANLGNYTMGLHNGCNRGLNQSSSWSDCISSTRVENQPANYKVVYYQNTNYGNRVFCIDTNGTTGIVQLNWPAVNDLISSFRTEGGNC